MADADEPTGSANARERPRKVTRGGQIVDRSIDGQPDCLHGEVNRSRQPTTTPSPRKSPPPLAPNPSHDRPSTASEQLQRRPSAEHLLILASGA